MNRTERHVTLIKKKNPLPGMILRNFQNHFHT